MRRFIVVSAQLQPLANNRIKQADIDPVGGEHTFNVGLWMPDDDPQLDNATAYWCNWNIDDQRWLLLTAYLESLGNQVGVNDPKCTRKCIAFYSVDDGWDRQSVLDDTTRKHDALKIGFDDPHAIMGFWRRDWERTKRDVKRVMQLFKHATA